MLQEFLSALTAQHPHLCPKQVLGARTGLLAAKLFELDLPVRGKRLFAFVETDGCFVDGVSIATNCRGWWRTNSVIF